jgi:hypothetical protein
MITSNTDTNTNTGRKKKVTYEFETDPVLPVIISKLLNELSVLGMNVVNDLAKHLDGLKTDNTIQYLQGVQEYSEGLVTRLTNTNEEEEHTRNNNDSHLPDGGEGKDEDGRVYSSPLRKRRTVRATPHSDLDNE